MPPEFTTEELTELAEFVCGRYDTLIDIATNAVASNEFKRGAKKDATSLAALNNKLRPWYKNRT